MNNKRKGCKFQATDIFYGFMVYAALGYWENTEVFSQYLKWVYYACIPTHTKCALLLLQNSHK